jgi:hypothetical protein
MSYSAATKVSVRPKTAWWRFPSTWIVSSPGNEALFSRAVWLIIPLQYYVLSKFPTGLKGEYVAVALVAVVSIVSLFVASLLFALAYYRAAPQNRSAREVEEKFGSTYALGVRMWAIALIVSWMAVHVVLAVSYAIGGAEGDLIDRLLCGDNRFSECNDLRPNFGVLTIVEYSAYTIVAIALLAAGGVLHRRLTTVRSDPPVFAEPNLAYVVVTIVILLTLINGSTTLPH